MSGLGPSSTKIASRVVLPPSTSPSAMVGEVVQFTASRKLHFFEHSPGTAKKKPRRCPRQIRAPGRSAYCVFVRRPAPGTLHACTHWSMHAACAGRPMSRTAAASCQGSMAAARRPWWWEAGCGACWWPGGGRCPRVGGDSPAGWLGRWVDPDRGLCKPRGHAACCPCVVLWFVRA